MASPPRRDEIFCFKHLPETSAYLPSDDSNNPKKEFPIKIIESQKEERVK